MSWFRDNTLNWVQRLCINVMKSGPVPKHVALIMDGNRRYAQKHNVEKIDGHSKGFDKLAETLVWCRDLGIPEVTVYAFSIENFNRSAEEVDGLMELARQKFRRLIDEKDKLMEHGVKVRIIGDLSLLPIDVRQLMAEVMKLTKDNDRACLNVAFAYTGREEITQAIRHTVAGLARGVLAPSDVTEDLISKCMYTYPSPYPDLLIRTSGEVRISDFLLWQISGCSIYFSKALWPEFSLWHMLSAIFSYQRSYASLIDLREKLQINSKDEPRVAEFLREVNTYREKILLGSSDVNCDL